MTVPVSYEVAMAQLQDAQTISQLAKSLRAASDALERQLHWPMKLDLSDANLNYDEDDVEDAGS
jgi:hypothetical protein